MGFKVEGLKGLKQTLKNVKERADYLARQAVEEISKDMEIDARKNFSRFARNVSADDRFVNVSRAKNSDYSSTIYCQGTQVLFIEFGVGVRNATSSRDNAERQPRPVIDGNYPANKLGGYGKGRGKDDYWVRPAQTINRGAGETAVLDRNGNVRQGVAWTIGHRPARALWRARFSAIQKYKERIGRFK